MGLADNIQREFTASRTGACAFGRLAATLPEADQKALDRAVEQVRDARRSGNKEDWRNAHAITAAAIRRALIAEGHTLSKDVVEKHVYMTCGCGN